MMHGVKNIFLGNTPSKERAFLCDFLSRTKDMYKYFCVPCCGKFAAVEAAVMAGWNPRNIMASDVSLFTTIVGRYVMDREIDDLGIATNHKDLMCEEGSHAEMLYNLKLAVMIANAKNYHMSLYVRDMKLRRKEHVTRIENDLNELKDKIGGMQYEIGDLFECGSKYLENPDAITMQLHGSTRLDISRGTQKCTTRAG